MTSTAESLATMYRFPPSTESFAAVFGLLVLAQVLTVARDYFREELRTTEDPAAFLIRDQCEGAVLSALRFALPTYFGIALLSFDRRYWDYNEVWDGLIAGPMNLGHAAGITAAYLVFAYRMGTVFADPWPQVLKAATRIPTCIGIAFLIGGVQLPEDVSSLSRVLRPAITLGLIWYTAGPLFRSFRGELRKFAETLSPLRLPCNSQPTQSHAPGPREEPLPCPPRANGSGPKRNRFSFFKFPLAPRGRPRRPNTR